MTISKRVCSAFIAFVLAMAMSPIAAIAEPNEATPTEEAAQVEASTQQASDAITEDSVQDESDIVPVIPNNDEEGLVEGSDSDETSLDEADEEDASADLEKDDAQAVDAIAKDDAALQSKNTAEAEADSEAELDPQAAVGVSYSTHVQSVGWQKPVENGATAGTTGQVKRVEALKATLNGISGNIEYRTHVQNIGWQGWVKNNAVAGTTGQSKRVEALEVRLTGDAASAYDVYYRVHVAHIGWMAWTKNGELAGTNGMSYAVEAVQIELVPVGSPAPSNAGAASDKAGIVAPTLTYQAHVQEIGWQGTVKNGATSGTTGQGKRVEALKANLNGGSLSGDISYSAHIQSIGWQSYAKNGGVAGTTGQGKRVEALKVKVDGEIARYFNVYYRVHVSNIGWMSWTKNGELAGTNGMSNAVEALQIKLVPVGNAAPSNSGASSNKAGIIAPKLTYQANVQGIGWQNWLNNGSVAGTTGQGKRVEAMRAKLSGSTLSGGISYAAHVENIGWQSSAYNGAVAGTTGRGLQIEAFAVNVDGEVAKYFDVYYRAHIENAGWLDWTSNGNIVGSTGCDLRVEAYQIKLVPKGHGAPGPTDNPMLSLYWVSPSWDLNVAITDIINNRTGRNLRSCFNYVSGFRYRTKATWPSYSGWQEDYALDMIRNGSGNCYSYATLFYFLAKACGYSGQVVSGQVPLARGGLGPHGWTEIWLNGDTYVCDPDLQYELGLNGYMNTYDNAPIQYYK